MESRSTLAKVLGAILSMYLLLGLGGCRSGAGSECLTDSDCKQGLVCVHKSIVVDGRAYPEKWGRCADDLDQDGIGSDGDYTGSSFDNRCGVHVEFHPQTGIETVYASVLGNCDDNCSDVYNTNILTKFGCLAKDPCCPISDAEKEKVESFYQCHDVTDQIDACTNCITGVTGGSPLPSVCFLNIDNAGGVDVDDDGCIHCRPLRNRVSCTLDDGVDSCATDSRLVQPACSGRWSCNTELSICTFSPKPFEDVDEDGHIVLYQLDRDWDGVGDQCDNCPDVPNGIECRNPNFAYRCDVNGDGETSPQEIEKYGNQRNSDGDMWGNACDLCPDVADNDNRDLDNDGDANPCDSDDDGDGICDPGHRDWTCTGNDNCREVPNPGQQDMDFDGKGNECDDDIDGDEIREDGDGSGVDGDNPCNRENGPCCENPESCADSDYLCRNCDDNCPRVYNPSQIDSDNDGLGDECDPD